MFLTVKTYRIGYIVNGSQFWEMIQAWSPNDAIMIIKQKFPNASTFTWREVS